MPRSAPPAGSLPRFCSLSGLGACLLLVVDWLAARGGQIARVPRRTLLHRANPVLRVGVVEITPMLQLAVLGGLWLWLTLVGAPDPLGLTVVIYMLVHGGRLVYVVSRVIVARRVGRPVVRARLVPLLDVQLGDDEQGTGQRRIAAAGAIAQGLYGLGLLLLTDALGGAWSPVVRETVIFVGWLYIVSEVNLLPLAGLDGATLWGWSWRSRPPWLRPGLGVLAGGVVAALVAIQVPTGYVHGVLVELSQPFMLIVAVVSVLCLVAVGRRLGLAAQASTTSQLEGTVP